MDPVLHIGGSELRAGTRVGNYEILRKIAVGGMAEIYLVRLSGAAGFEKVMVLKRVLPSVVADARYVQMFLNEARLQATLRHPNIADVFDVGEHDGSYFFTMEYVHGEEVRTIRRVARERKETVSLPITLAIVHAVASALHYCHEKLGPDGKRLGLVHRDISTSNIMVSYDGAIKLLDFGVARVTSETHQTQTGALKGKVPYMSPEQCRCMPLDRRSDLFSLGVILYELTVGRRPFRGTTPFEIMEHIIHGSAPLPSTVIQGYPADLEAMVMKLLARAPDDRYATADDVVRDLDEFVAKHGQWASSRAIVRYMRSLFTSDIEAWENAQEQGVAFADHVVTTITSQSNRSASAMTPIPQSAGGEPATKLFTPMRRVEVSNVSPVVPPPPPQLDNAIEELVEESPPPARNDHRVSYPVVPTPPRIKVGRALLAIFVFLVIAGAGVLAFYWLQHDLEQQQHGD